jgi:16S rRNA (uracil1498-N3)-methyltransferase
MNNIMNHVFCHTLTATSDAIPATDAVRRHLDAMRIRDGEQVRVFNGRGVVSVAMVERQGGSVVLRAMSHTVVPMPPPLRLAFGVLDHRDRLEFAIEKATELGVTHLFPLSSDHVQFRKWSDERAQAKMVAALTQSGQAWLPQIAQPSTVDALLNTLPSDDTIILGSDTGGAVHDVQSASGTTVCVGPEGGFSQRELDLFTADRRTIQIAIGRSRLRAETAAVALLAAWVGVQPLR